MEDLTTKSILDWLDLPSGLVVESVEVQRLDDREAFRYYCYSLHLLAALCDGRNVFARENILAFSNSQRLGLEFVPLHNVVRYHLRRGCRHWPLGYFHLTRL